MAHFISAWSDRPILFWRQARWVCLILLLHIGGNDSSAQIVNCPAFRDGALYVGFEADNYLEGSVPTYSNPECADLLGSTIDYDDGLVYAPTRLDGSAICDANNGEQFNDASPWFTGHDPNVWECQPGQLPPSLRPTQAPPSSGGSSRGGSTPKVIATPRPAIHTGIILNLETDLRVSAIHGLTSGIQFQRVGIDGVGIQSLADLGVLDAVDVWANIGGGYEVCFPQSGNIVFLDTAITPRIPEPGQGYARDGYTCAFYTRAGIVVLMKAAQGTETEDDSKTEAPTPTIRHGTRDDIADAFDLADCGVTPRINLNLREGPWEEILDVLPANRELPATARTENWFKLTYRASQGWSAAWLVTAAGDCDWPPNGSAE